MLQTTQFEMDNFTSELWSSVYHPSIERLKHHRKQKYTRDMLRTRESVRRS